MGGSMLNFGMVMYLRDNVTNSAQRINHMLHRMGMSASAFSNRFNTAMNQIGIGIAMVSMAAMGLGAVFDSLQVAGEFEQTTIAINTMAGSLARGTKLIKDLKEQALATPFDFKDLVANTRKLMAYGVTTKEVVRDMRMLGDIAAGVGKERLPFLTLAYGQIKTKGRLMGEERRQLSESGVGITGALAKKIYGSDSAGARQQLVNALEAKKLTISFEQVREVLREMTEEGGIFYGLMDRQSKSLLGRVSNLREQFYFLQVTIGNQLLGAATTFLDKAQDGFRKLNEFFETSIGSNVLKGGIALIALVGVLGLLVTISGLAKVAIHMIGLAFSAQTRPIITMALATGKYGLAMKTMLSSLATGVVGFSTSLVSIGGALAGFMVFQNILASIFGWSSALEAIPTIFGALVEVWQNMSTLGQFSFISDDTRTQLQRIGASGEFNFLAKQIFRAWHFSQGFGESLQMVGGWLSWMGGIGKNAFEFGGHDSGFLFNGFKTITMLGKLVGLLVGLRVVIFTVGYAYKFLAKSANIIFSPFKRMFNFLNKGRKAFLGFYKSLRAIGFNRVRSVLIGLVATLGRYLAKITGLRRAMIVFRSIQTSVVTGWLAIRAAMMKVAVVQRMVNFLTGKFTNKIKLVIALVAAAAVLIGLFRSKIMELVNYVRNSGFGQALGIDLPTETDKYDPTKPSPILPQLPTGQTTPSFRNDIATPSRNSTPTVNNFNPKVDVTVKVGEEELEDIKTRTDTLNNYRKGN